MTLSYVAAAVPRFPRVSDTVGCKFLVVDPHWYEILIVESSESYGVHREASPLAVHSQTHPRFDLKVVVAG